MSEHFDLTAMVEMMATQKAALERVQGLLDDLYPGLKARFTFTGIEVSGPQTQFAMFKKDMAGFHAKKQGSEAPKEH